MVAHGLLKRIDIETLMAACKAETQRLVSILLEKEANTESRNKDGQSIQDVVKESIKMAECTYNRSLVSKLKKVPSYWSL